MAATISQNPIRRSALALCILLLLMIPGLHAFADTIVFQDSQAQQNGTVISEDSAGVTIRFSKTAIKSIRKTPENRPVPNGDKVILEEKDGFHILKIPDHLLQTGSAAAGQNSASQAPEASLKAPPASKELAPRIEDKLIEEEMSPVQGTILWQGRPLRGSVKIVMTQYTGFSFAALLKAFSSRSTAQSNKNEIVLTTTTDDQGRYFFAKVPPGFYRLYWQPEGETDWIHRLRDKPDLEVMAGRMNTQNIPAK